MTSPKKSIQHFKGYVPNLDAYEIKLDANEEKDYLSQYFEKTLDFSVNLYPDNDNLMLTEALARKWNLNKDQIIIGNGSSEILELLVKVFVDKDEPIISFEPSFSMYKVYADIHGANFIPVLGNKDFSLNIDVFMNAVKQNNPKLIFLCTPNNPTGYLIPKEMIVKILSQTDAIVCVDEAYMEFSSKDTSVISFINDYPNLVVTRTFSKAYGLASLRLGYALGNKDVIQWLKKVKAPYSVNSFSQSTGLKALKLEDKMIDYTESAIKRRKKLVEALKKLNVEIFDSEANFIFFKSQPNLYSKLIQKGIIIRSFSGNLDNYYRVTVGTEFENNQFIKAMEAILNESSS